mgnify:CR=1 FL=1
MPRHDFLAGARLAHQQHRHGRRRHARQTCATSARDAALRVTSTSLSGGAGCGAWSSVSLRAVAQSRGFGERNGVVGAARDRFDGGASLIGARRHPDPRPARRRARDAGEGRGSRRRPPRRRHRSDQSAGPRIEHPFQGAAGLCPCQAMTMTSLYSCHDVIQITGPAEAALSY